MKNRAGAAGIGVSSFRHERFWAFALIGAATLLAACGTEEPKIETDRAALTDPDAPGHEFDLKGGREMPPNAANDITHYSDPALCSNEIATFLITSMDSTGLYRTLFNDQETRPANWGNYGTKTFASRPACAMREQGRNGRGFVLVGKGKTDNKLYASPGSWDPVLHDGNPLNPTADAVWTLIDPSAPAYTRGGSPALATDSSTTSILLAYIDDSNHVNAREHVLPYTANSWSAPAVAPALPAGWTAVGTPAVAFLQQWALYFQIVVRVKNGSQTRLLTTYYITGVGYSGPVPRSSPSWTQVPITDSFDSDPALAYSPTLATATLYYRSGKQLHQTSGFVGSLGQNLVHAVAPNNGISYPDGSNPNQAAASPSALSIPFENSNNMVIARDTLNQLYESFSVQDTSLIP